MISDVELHGLVVRADLPLDGPAAAARRPDVTVRMGDRRPVGMDVPSGDTLLHFALDDRLVYAVVRDGRRELLRVPGICDFFLDRQAGEVEWVADPEAATEYVALLVRGALLATWLALQGDCVLHASVVELPDGTGVAVTGVSGMGKSTLAALLCEAGALFVSDDLLRLDTGDPPRWVGGSSELRLRAAAAEIATRQVHAWTVRDTVDGRTAVVVPRPDRAATKVETVRVDPIDAVLLLSQFPRLDGWRAPEVLAAQFDGAARLAAGVPVYQATVPWGPPFDARTGADLLAAVAVVADDAREADAVAGDRG